MGPYSPVPGIKLIWVLALGLPNLGRDNAGRDRAGNAPGDLVLDGKDIGQFAVVAIRPQMMASCRLDQLPGDADAIAGPPHAALEHVAHAQLAPNFDDIKGRNFVGERGAARDHKKEWLCDRLVMMSSVMPSEKYSCSASPLIFAKGSTAIDGFCGSGRADRREGAAGLFGSSQLALRRMRCVRTG